MSMTNCVNCGAAKDVSETVCPFCGTPMFDLTDIDLSNNGKTIVVRFRFGDRILDMKSYISNANFAIDHNDIVVRNMSGQLCRARSEPHIRATIEFVSA